jgi:hypothetical protein
LVQQNSVFIEAIEHQLDFPENDDWKQSEDFANNYAENFKATWTLPVTAALELFHGKRLDELVVIGKSKYKHSKF